MPSKYITQPGLINRGFARQHRQPLAVLGPVGFESYCRLLNFGFCRLRNFRQWVLLLQVSLTNLCRLVLPSGPVSRMRCDMHKFCLHLRRFQSISIFAFPAALIPLFCTSWLGLFLLTLAHILSPYSLERRCLGIRTADTRSLRPIRRLGRVIHPRLLGFSSD